MRNLTDHRARLWCLTAAVLSACGSPPLPSGTSGPRADSEGYQPLAMPCSISSGVVTISLDANEQATISIDGAGQLIVNSQVCSSATTTTMRRINVSTATPTALTSETVIVDGSSGFFALGSSSSAGITIALGSGTGDLVQVIGTPGDDVIISGRAASEDWIILNHDLYADLHLTGVDGLTLTGGDGNDVLTGAALYATWVRASYYTTGLAHQKPLTLEGGAGNDTLTGGDASDQLLGGDDNDTLTGGLGDDTVSGGLGDDTLDEGPTSSGSDTLIGGDGSDRASYGSRSTTVTVSLGSSANDGAPSEADDVRVDVETVIGGTGDDSLTCHSSAGCTLYGGPGNDTLTGRGGDDSLMGEAGNDRLKPGPGNDVINGGAGTDTILYDDATAGVSVTLGTIGTPSTGNGAPSQSEDDSIDSVEDITGSAYGDVLTGNALANRIAGGAGNDTLSGFDGDDVFDEGDTSSGQDTINGGNGEDRVDYGSRLAALQITLDGVADDGQSSPAEQDNLGDDVEDVTGGSGDDFISGNALDNKLDGMLGADTLSGLGGRDELTGGPGYDTLNGGDSDDILDASADGAACDCGDGFDIAICASAPISCEVR